VASRVDFVHFHSPTAFSDILLCPQPFLACLTTVVVFYDEAYSYNQTDLTLAS